MRQKLRSHLTFANVCSLTALFVALGGTTYAATGDPFLLGKSNSAGAPTQLSSATTNAAGALKVTSTATSGGRAIQGTSAHGQGVYGHSGSNAGVVGDSSTFDGVFGVSNDTDSAGVSGHGNGGGYGVFAVGGNRLFNTAAMHAESSAGNAIEGYSTGGPASGVFGQDNNANSYGVAGHSDNGVAVVGDSSSGWAMQALGNTTQSRTRGGFVKAMARVGLFFGDMTIFGCFNSQVAASQAQVKPCGMTATRVSAGDYKVNFGFQVDDRFYFASGTSCPAGSAVTTRLANTTTVEVFVRNASNNPQDCLINVFVF